MSLYNSINALLDDELKARIDDCLAICERQKKPKFLGFFDEQRSAAIRLYTQRNNIDCRLFGGYDDAGRVLAGFFPSYVQNEDCESLFPISALTFTFRIGDTLSHRDFLGSILSLGIRREKIGDILVGEGFAVVFADSSIAGYIAEQISKIGRVGVKIRMGYDRLPPPRGFAELEAVVASARIDCVAAALTGKSRESAKSLILSQNVSINHLLCTDTSYKTVNDDVISIKGCGRFIVVSVDNMTKRGKIKLKAKKFL